MKRTVLTLLLLSISYLISYAQQYELPKISNSDLIIKHLGYTLSFNTKHKNANWVAYNLTKEKVNKKVTQREDKFKEDPLLKNQTATNEDYLKSGYDRGHLSPAADNLYNIQCMKESFYYSNISLQVPAFNRGIWETLEEQVRFWANKYENIYIVTGPILTDNLKTIGNKVSVPKQFYKAIIYVNGNKSLGIAFLMNNQNSKASISKFVISIDELEKLLNIDLFTSVPINIQNEIESGKYPFPINANN